MSEGPRIHTPPPGPRARAVIARDARVMSQNFRKDYPLVVDRARGALVEDVDGKMRQAEGHFRRASESRPRHWRAKSASATSQYARRSANCKVKASSFTLPIEGHS